MSDRADESLPEWTQEELSLLRSADEDRPPARSLPAAFAAVGVGGAIVAGAAGAQAAAAGAGAAAVGTAAGNWGGAIAISKWVVVVALSGAAVTGGVVFTRRTHLAKAPAAHAVRAVHATTATKPVVLPAHAEPAGAAPTQPAPDQPARSPARAMRTSSPAAKRESPSQPDIHVEIEALDAALASLRSGNASEALAALDRYDANFKNGSLRVEATALRIEALVRAGNRSKAAALAGPFLASHANSPYAARVRALLGR